MSYLKKLMILGMTLMITATGCMQEKNVAEEAGSKEIQASSVEIEELTNQTEDAEVVSATKDQKETESYVEYNDCKMGLRPTWREINKEDNATQIGTLLLNSFITIHSIEGGGNMDLESYVESFIGVQDNTIIKEEMEFGEYFTNTIPAEKWAEAQVDVVGRIEEGSLTNEEIETVETVKQFLESENEMMYYSKSIYIPMANGDLLVIDAVIDTSEEDYVEKQISYMLETFEDHSKPLIESTEENKIIEFDDFTITLPKDWYENQSMDKGWIIHKNMKSNINISQEESIEGVDFNTLINNASSLGYPVEIGTVSIGSYMLTDMADTLTPESIIEDKIENGELPKDISESEKERYISYLEEVESVHQFGYMSLNEEVALSIIVSTVEDEKEQTLQALEEILESIVLK